MACLDHVLERCKTCRAASNHEQGYSLVCFATSCVSSPVETNPILIIVFIPVFEFSKILIFLEVRERRVPFTKRKTHAIFLCKLGYIVRQRCVLFLFFGVCFVEVFEILM